MFLGSADQDSAAVVMASRLPRMLAGIVVGLALGVAGAALQSISRNVLASPDTLAVNAGAYFALGIASVTGFTLPLLASSGSGFCWRPGSRRSGPGPLGAGNRCAAAGPGRQRPGPGPRLHDVRPAPAVSAGHRRPLPVGPGQHQPGRHLRRGPGGAAAGGRPGRAAPAGPAHGRAGPGGRRRQEPGRQRPVHTGWRSPARRPAVGRGRHPGRAHRLCGALRTCPGPATGQPVSSGWAGLFFSCPLPA